MIYNEMITPKRIRIEYIFDFICKNRNNRIEDGCKYIYNHNRLFGRTDQKRSMVEKDQIKKLSDNKVECVLDGRRLCTALCGIWTK